MTHPQAHCEVSVPHRLLLLTVFRRTSWQKDSMLRTDGGIAGPSTFGQSGDNGRPLHGARPSGPGPQMIVQYLGRHSLFVAAPTVQERGPRIRLARTPPDPGATEPAPRPS